MPGSRLMQSKLRDELVHLGIELDDQLVRVIVVPGNVVAGCMPRRAPKLVDSSRTKAVRRHGMIGRVLELEGNVMKPRVRSVDDVDHMVVPSR